MAQGAASFVLTHSVYYKKPDKVKKSERRINIWPNTVATDVVHHKE